MDILEMFREYQVWDIWWENVMKNDNYMGTSNGDKWWLNSGWNGVTHFHIKPRVAESSKNGAGVNMASP